jgi:hypothetical protein
MCRAVCSVNAGQVSVCQQLLPKASLQLYVADVCQTLLKRTCLRVLAGEGHV